MLHNLTDRGRAGKFRPLLIVLCISLLLSACGGAASSSAAGTLPVIDPVIETLPEETSSAEAASSSAETAGSSESEAGSTAEESSTSEESESSSALPESTAETPAETTPAAPQPTEPEATEPKPTEPKPTEPKPTEPKPTEPKPTEPKPTEPKPTEPKPTEPKPTETQPAETKAPETAADGLAALLAEAGFSEGRLKGSQLVVVRSEGTSCRIFFYEKQNGIWHKAPAVAEASGFVGRDGVGDAYEGSKLTPRGYYALGPSFGEAADPGIDMEYFQLHDYDYWIDDVNSPYYNQHVDGRYIKDWSSAEDLGNMLNYYKYAVVIRYNMDPIVPGKGSAFFFHMDTKPTSGCVGTTEETMRQVFSWLHESAEPHILIY